MMEDSSRSLITEAEQRFPRPIPYAVRFHEDDPTPPTAGSSASETPAFPPTGVSLYSRLLFEMPRRGEIVQIATGWRFGSSNSRSLRSGLHHGRAGETASQMALDRS